MRICKVKGCQKAATAKGMCGLHYQQAYRARKKATESGKVVKLVPKSEHEPTVQEESLEIRKLEQEVLKLELANQEKAGMLLQAEDVRTEWLEHLASMRTGLEAAPGWIKTHSPDPFSPGQMATIREWIDAFVGDLGIELGS